MIDTLKKFYKSSRENKPYKKFGLKENDYVIITMHRPSNVDSITDLRKYIKLFNEMSERIPFIFPMHPRTKNIIDENKIKIDKNIRIVEPLSYRVFLGLLSNCKMVFTDSGGIQEETTYLNIQCITIRDNIERPITVELGTNHLVGTNPKVIKNKFNQIMNGEIKRCNIPPQWDGKTGQRIVSIINDYLKI